MRRLGGWLEQLSKVKKRQKARYRVYSSEVVAVKLHQVELNVETQDSAPLHTKKKKGSRGRKQD